MNKAGIAKPTQVAIGLCGIEFPKRRVLGSSETACTSSIIVVFSPYRTDVPILHKSKVNIFICVVLGCSLAHDFFFFISRPSTVLQQNLLVWTIDMASSKKVAFSVLSREQSEGVGARVRRSIGRPEVHWLCGNLRLPQPFSSLFWFLFVGAMTRSLTLGFRVLGIELLWS